MQEQLPQERKRTQEMPRPKRTEQFESEREHRDALIETLERPAISSRAGLELLANYEPTPDEQTTEKVRSLVSSYGLAYEKLTPHEQRSYAALYLGTKGKETGKTSPELAAVLDEALRDRLTEKAFTQLGELREAMTQAESLEGMKQKLRDVMEAMAVLAKQATPEKDQNAETWTRLFREFTSLSKLKGKVSKDVGALFGEVFEEYQDMIENEFVLRESQRLEKANKPHSLEHLMKDIFGRTKEELENIKKRNRANVADWITTHKDEPPTVEVLEQLHRINNDGIVPKEQSRLRRGYEHASFGRRSGIIGQDVEPEMRDLETRARLASVEEQPDALYEITVAKLHNDILDIHPFPDRNGSTSLLFIEFMMAKRGYTPNPEREKHYYNHLRKALGNNPVAVGIVGHAQWKIMNVPGYYEKGATTKGKEKLYTSILNLIGQRKKERDQAKKEKKAKKSS